MEKGNGEYKPLEYNEERLAKFYVRATHGTNFPRIYKPDFDEVDLPAFADAIIGFYIAKSQEVHKEGSVRHAANLGRAAFAIKFLEGVPHDHLKESIHGDGPALKKGVLEFALGVAGEGARYAQETVLNDAPMPENKKRATKEYHSVDQFVDLDGVIKDMYAEGRITPGKAQALLLLLRQATSTANPLAQRRALDDVCFDLRTRLKKTIIHQPHAGEELIDQTFAKSAMYLKTIVASPQAMLDSDRVFEILTDHEAKGDSNSAPREVYRAQVFGHIGYGLNKLY